MATTSLVTGGAGFIGAHVVRHLLGAGHKVVVLDDLSGGARDQVDHRSVFVEGSILDLALLESIFSTHKPEYVYHLAAYAAEGLSHFIRRFNYNNNLIGSVNLINLSVKTGVKCFVFTSSIAVYGSQQPPLTEEHTPMPEDPYGVAKYAVELDLECAHRMFGLNYIIFRPHNVYGEYQNIGDRYRNVVGIFMNQLMQGLPLTVFGDGRQTRAFSYIDDVAPVIAASVATPQACNRVFNIGADREYTVLELAHQVMEAMGVKGQIQFLPARQEALHAWADHSLVREVFGHRQAVTLETGLRNMAEWARNAGARRSTVFTDIELTQNLPASWATGKNQ